MKLLLDTCVWGGACAALRDAGHDVVWTGMAAEDPGDEEILAKAYGEQRILVTLDKDFGELAVVRGMPHSGIVRLVDIAATRQAEMILYITGRYADELIQGAIITVSNERVRIRSAPR
jgi:predicted nuclease of predicted toxin-antitoxin system